MESQNPSTVEELGWGNSPFPIPAFSLQPFAFSLFFTILDIVVARRISNRLILEGSFEQLKYFAKIQV
ncbi:MAG: hypothetical protein AAF316_00695 [Cyanobacteria bacterium P01_A01_bin.80]